MADKEPTKLRHILLKDSAVPERYTSPKTGGPDFKIPSRNRQAHGTFLKERLDHIKEESIVLGQEKVIYGIDARNGINITFESDPDFPLKLESMEQLRAGIELLAVNLIDKKTFATVYVPDGKLSFFVKRVEQYLTEVTKKNKFKHKDLIESISNVRRAALDALWTDERREFPTSNQAIWWEVWLRAGRDKAVIESSFREHAVKLGLRISADHIRFPDRTIILAYGTRDQMSKSVDLLNCVAELRKAKETAEVFTKMSPPFGISVR